MGMLADARVLLALARGAGAGGDHAERLARFYGPQASDYDRFRERLLHGRRALIEALPVAAGDRVAELGGGTGRNVEFFGERLPRIGCVRIIDLCEPLLAVARRRFADHPNVCCTLADATRWRPDAPLDCVYFSYALTMIPDWRAAIDNAIAMLAPGGALGVVDFHVAPEHGWATRAFWPRWFAHDGVRLSTAHLPYLQTRLQPVQIEQRRAPVPYLPGPTVPYYLFIGRKRP
jgi:S-adenosylmethionine-diacylgycerolhomoserine-N-methlytransferase